MRDEEIYLLPKLRRQNKEVFVIQNSIKEELCVPFMDMRNEDHWEQFGFNLLKENLQKS